MPRTPRCESALEQGYQVVQACLAALPDEKTRRVGQSVAAASLPELRKNA